MILEICEGDFGGFCSVRKYFIMQLSLLCTPTVVLLECKRTTVGVQRKPELSATEVLLQ